MIGVALMLACAGAFAQIPAPSAAADGTAAAASDDGAAPAVDSGEQRLLRELWINDQLTQADRLFQRADFATAIRVLEKIVERYPDSEDATNARQLIEAIRENAGDLITVEQGP